MRADLAGESAGPRVLPLWCPPLEALLAVARLSPDAILIVREDPEDATREIAWSNPAFDRLLGQPSSHLVGHPVFALRTRHVAPDVSESSGESALQDLLELGCGQSDMSLRRVDTSLAVVRTWVTPVEGP